MYKTVQINYGRKVFTVIAYSCVLTSVPLTYVSAFGFVGCILFFQKGCLTEGQKGRKRSKGSKGPSKRLSGLKGSKGSKS